MAASDAQRRRPEPDRLPNFPPDNELPAAVEVGPLVWRSGDVGITATGFLAYSTGVLFRLIALSKGVTLGFEDPLGQFAGEPGHFGRTGEQPSGPLRLGAHGVPVTSHHTSRSDSWLKITAWAPFPPDGDLIFYLEWPAGHIEYCEFGVPRGAAAKAIVLWPAQPSCPD